MCVILRLMDVHVFPPGSISWSGRRFRCALGAGGVVKEKCEGDGATPEGDFPLRLVMYRPDRMERPKTSLSVRALAPDDGWCDDPESPHYNTLVRLPFKDRHEVLWRGDGVYDLIVVIGYNDDPPAPGLGSAIFIHLAKPDYGPTEGCVALGLEGLKSLIGDCDEETRLIIRLGQANGQA